MTHTRSMKLGAALFPTGAHDAAWRDPLTPADGGTRFAHLVEAAQTAERGLMDFVFFADHLALRDPENPQSIRRLSITRFEPFTLLAGLAATTERIGLVCTASTSFHQPYTIARLFASLDLMSGGRAGWNLVTSAQDTEAQNFNLSQHYAHTDRYRRAEEFADVVRGLWDSWDPDAFKRDKDSGIFFDPAGMHALNHRGEHYAVRGPLDIAPSPQRQPVIFQAGSSGTGKAFAAKYAEAVFTAQTSLAAAQAFYADIKRDAAGLGRNPDNVLVMPGIFPVIGATQQDAERKYQALNALTHIDVAVTKLSIMIGFDLSKFPLDGPLPPMPQNNASLSRRQMLVERATRENLTIRQLAQFITESQGATVMMGTAAQIADRMEEWFLGAAADGFIITPLTLPHGLEDVTQHLVPELQHRGLFRRQYAGKTLRDHLGVPVPTSRNAGTPA